MIAEKKTSRQAKTGVKERQDPLSLPDSNPKYRQMIDSIDDGYYEVDLTGRFTFFNDTLPKLTGYGKESLIGANYRILMDNANAERVFQAFNEVYRTGAPARLFEWKITTKSGAPIHVQSSIFLIRNSEGQPVGFRGLTRDITEKKIAEERLRESEQRFRSLVENLNDVIYTMDAQGRFTYVSPSVERIAGYDASEMIGQPLSKYIPAEDIPTMYDWLEKALADGTKDTELRVLTKDGRILNMRTSVRTHHPEGETEAVLHGLMTDITEYKLLQEELRALAVTDPMTGIYNRRGFTTLAEQHMRSSSRTRMKMLLFFCDLDYMKIINDALGHLEGDRAILDTSLILKRTFREADIIARIGGDEFAILSLNTADILPEYLLSRLQHQFDLHNAEANRSYQLHVSIGCAAFDPDDPCTLDDLMTRADTAMYEQKKLKRL
jgi:diguanylate cyclase (GGDEF)-like protein/PAS domain S-box-containing protein